MDCREIRLSLDALLDRELDPSVEASIDQHILTCADCRLAVQRERELRTALAALPLVKPAAGFQDRVLRNARHRSAGPGSHALVGMALAATLALGIGLGVLFAPGTSHIGPSPVRAGVQQVDLVQAVAQNVRLAFESAQSLQGVTLTVRLPADVELVGYPGQREISWQTDLEAGVNALTLPLVLTGRDGGELVAELDHGAQSRQFRVRIQAQSAGDAAVASSPLII